MASSSRGGDAGGAPPDPSPGGAPRPPDDVTGLPTAVGLGLLAVAFVALRGYSFGISNQSLQVPLLKHVLDPSLYRNDAVLSSFSGYASFFFILLAPLVRAVGSIEAAYFVLFFLCEFAILATIYALSLWAFKDRGAAALACVLYHAGLDGLGQEGTTLRLLTHSAVVGALLLADIYLYVQGRRVWAVAIAGVLFNLHALYALHVVLLLSLDSLLEDKASRRDLAKGLGLALLGALPAGVWILRGESVPPDLLPAWLGIMRERSGFHAFPTVLSPAVYGRYLLVLALAGLAVPARPCPRFHRLLLRFGLGVLILALVALVFSEWIPVVAVIKAQLLRSSRWLSFLVLVSLGSFLKRSFEWGGLLRAASVVGILAIVARQPGWLALSLALYLLAGSRRFPAPAVALAVLALVVSAKTAAAPLEAAASLEGLGSMLGGLLASPVAVASLGLVALLVSSLTKPRLLAALVPISVATAVLVLLPALYREHIADLRAVPWNEAQVWVKENTPQDAVILTPPELAGFRVFSERAIVVEAKDGTQQFFSARFGMEWHRRMEALGAPTRSFSDLDAARLLAVAREYRASYIVCRRKQPLPLPLLHRNAQFAVYAVAEAPGPS